MADQDTATNPFAKYANQPPAAADQANPFAKYTRPAAAPAAPPKDEPNMLTRIWNGLTKGDASTGAGSFGVGMADPAVGAAQFGARYMEEQPVGYTAEQQQAVSPEAYQERVKAVDEGVAQREQHIQDTRPAESKLSTDWWRLAGNIPGTAAIAPTPGMGAAGVAMRGAPLATKLAISAGMGGLGGAIGGAAQPQLPGDSKALQAGAGAVGGALVGPAATALGAGLGAAGRGVRDLFGRGEPAQAPLFTPGERAITARAEKVIPPQRADHLGGFNDLVAQRKQDLEVFNDLVANKDSLKLDTARGWETGRIPMTLEEGLQAVQKGKDRLFPEFDKMTQQADLAPLTTGSTINKFNQAFDEAAKREAAAVQEVAAANRALTLETAKQSQAANVYSTSAANRAAREARNAVTKAENRLNQARIEKEAAQRDISRPWVDLKPIANDLENWARDPAMKLSKKFENTRLYAQDEAKILADTEAISASTAQSYIRKANKSLEAFYANPNYETAARAGVDAQIARHMRVQLDEMITNAVGPGYQKIKSLHGSYQAVEDRLLRRLTGQPAEEPFINRLINAGSMEEMARGLLTLNPEAIARGALVKGITQSRRAAKTVDKEVMRLFREVEKQQRIQNAGSRPSMFYRAGPGTLPAGAGGAAADEQRNVRRYSLPAPEDRFRGTAGTVQ